MANRNLALITLTSLCLFTFGCNDSNTSNDIAQNESTFESEEFDNANPGMDSTDEPQTVTANKVIDETTEAVESFKDLVELKKDEFVEAINSQLEETNDEIEQLKNCGDELQDEAQENWNDLVSEIDEQRERLREQLAELQDSGEEASEELQEETAQTWKQLKEALRDAQDRYRSESKQSNSDER
ncbi:hypothetical protein KOR42_40820 [Thalassoglobus neptunius]|uniref:Uncharacterized protein n=1 Tax=Thalassoglobus neptunius TaxID=1938619 RepID=A0A5C5WBA3_9PLAN|nr:CCDC85 family [Thalassoglobus neptunius]TWT47884.1 hypothetical protein KOR42_40820 [Thalassoglobus neptunius]